MQIYWHGLSSIRIETKTGETQATVVTDPYTGETGLRFPRTLEPEIVLCSHQDRKRCVLDGFASKPFMVSEPGEYEVAGVFVRAIQDIEKDPEMDERHVIYRIDAEDISIAFLGRIDRKLSSKEVGELGDIDILMIPVGGGSVLDAETAQSVMQAIEPRIVIPMYYGIKGVKEKLDDVEAFCKKLGSCTREDVNKLKISKKDLPQDTMQIVVIERA